MTQPIGRREAIKYALLAALFGTTTAMTVLETGSQKPISSSNINELLDVVIAGPQLWDRLVYDGANWVNKNDRTFLFLKDDFLAGLNEAGEFGELGWDVIGTGTKVFVAEANHPGCVNITATSTAVSSGLRLSPNTVQMDDFWEFEFYFKAHTAQTGMRARVGVARVIDAAGNGIWFEFDDSVNANWQSLVSWNGGASQFSEDTGIAYTVGTWYRMKIKVVNTDKIEFYIDDVLVSDLTESGDGITIPAATGEFSAWIENVDLGTAKSVRLDFFRGAVTVSR